MMVARPVGRGGVNDLTTNNNDAIIGKDVIDAHAGALVGVDEVGRHRVPASHQRNGVSQAKSRQAAEDHRSAFNETLHGTFGVGREAAERRGRLLLIEVILGADAIEVATDDEWPRQILDQADEVERLIGGMAKRTGMIG